MGTVGKRTLWAIIVGPLLGVFLKGGAHPHTRWYHTGWIRAAEYAYVLHQLRPGHNFPNMHRMLINGYRLKARNALFPIMTFVSRFNVPKKKIWPDQKFVGGVDSVKKSIPVKNEWYSRIRLLESFKTVFSASKLTQYRGIWGHIAR